MCEGISGHILLKSQLKLGYYALMKSNFESDVGDRDRLSEPTLDLENSEFLWIFYLEWVHIIYDLYNGLENIFDVGEGAFPSDHIADGEL